VAKVGWHSFKDIDVERKESSTGIIDRNHRHELIDSGKRKEKRHWKETEKLWKN